MGSVSSRRLLVDSEFLEDVESHVQRERRRLADHSGADHRRCRDALSLDPGGTDAGRSAGAHGARDLPVHHEQRLAVVGIVQRYRVKRPGGAALGRVVDVRAVLLDPPLVDVSPDVRWHRAEPTVGPRFDPLGVAQPTPGNRNYVTVNVLSGIAHGDAAPIVEFEVVM